MEARLELKLSQKLVMTPQLQQAIKLLQLSRLELVQSISQELVENPVLEELAPDDTSDDSAEGEELQRQDATPSADGQTESAEIREERPEEIRSELEIGPQWDEYMNEMGDGRDFGSIEADDRELPSYDQTLTKLPSLQDYLLWQLHLTALPEEVSKAGEWIIGNLDDDGYLRATLEEVAHSSAVRASDLEAALIVIQGLDPSGVGARDLQECLLIQIKHLGMQGSLVELIVRHHLGDLERRKYAAIAKALTVELQEVQAAADFISHGLEPRPGGPYAASNTNYVVPDVYVIKIEDRYVLQLNEDGVPRIRINPYYRRLFHHKDEVDKATKEYLEERLRSAQWLIKGMEQRNKTIYKVAESIVRFQREFLDHGIAYLRPMVLRDVAEDIGAHESTISRVTTNKFIHTPQGLFPMKYFFTTGFVAGTGAEVSSLTVKDTIQKMVREENRAAPLKDQQIVELLKARGIDIARRTVAKYREELRIPPTSTRKRLD